MKYTSQALPWCSAFLLAAVQVLGQDLPSSFPHIYPNIPNTKNDFSDSAAWQGYFEVKDAMPNVTFPLTRSFAGNIPVNRQGHKNNTLFFWAFEKMNGSLTSDNKQDPWVIWLNGGPGSSSMLGLLLENGPIHFNLDFTAFANNFSWNTLADTIWIDQPVGTGWSTSDAEGYIADEDQMGEDFFGFLSNLVQVFPSLAQRPLYLTGESYCGVYIPYLAKTYFSLSHPPVNLRKIAIGDGLYGAFEPLIAAPVVSALETYPQLIGYDPEVFAYFKDQAHLCGLDINLTYPQNGIIPTIPVVPGAIQGGSPSRSVGAARNMFSALTRDTSMMWKSRAKRGFTPRHDEEARRAWKRNIPGGTPGTINPWYGCDVFDEMIDYAVNFTLPWKGHDFSGFDVYYIPDALEPEAPPTPDSVGSFLNDPSVVAAIHAPTSKDWVADFTAKGYPFGNGFSGGILPMLFFSELASNLSAHDIKWILYSGNADVLLPHLGTEIVIQNTTFGGIQGFTQIPSTPWFDEAGNFAGKIHQERNLTYALFAGAGHLVPQIKPVAAFTFLKEFILGDNELGTVLANGTVVGGTNATLANAVLPAVTDPIFTGSDATQGTYFFPSATVAAWNSFTHTAVAAQTGTHKSGNAHPTAGWPLPTGYFGTVLCFILWIIFA